MALPVIAYDNHLRLAAAAITDPGSATGFPVANLKDYRSYSLWKSNTTVTPINIDVDLTSGYTANYLMLVNHNLFTLSSLVELMGDNASPASTVRLTLTPGENTVSYGQVATTSAYRYWRIRIRTSGGGAFPSAPFVGELFFGLKLDLPQYLAPTFDPFFKQVEVQGARSRGGHYLGASLRGQMHRGDITFGEAGAPRADFTASLNAFLDNHAYKRYPFGFVLDTADADFDTARYVKVPDDAEISRRAVGGSWSNLTFVLPVEEAYAEPA